MRKFENYSRKQRNASVYVNTKNGKLNTSRCTASRQMRKNDLLAFRN